MAREIDSIKTLYCLLRDSIVMMYDRKLHSTDKFCKITFATDSDRKKALYELIHEKRVNFSNVGNNQFVLPKEVCNSLGKSIKIKHVK